MAKKINTNGFEIDKQMIAAVASLVDGMMSKMSKGIDDANQGSKKMKKTWDDVAKSSTNIYRNLQLDKIVNTTKVIQSAVVDIGKTINTATGATVKEWNAMVSTMFESTRKLNSEIGKAVFSSKDFLVAAQTLAGIGWKDLSAIQNVAPALAQINKAVGTTTSAFTNSITQLQRTFKDGTANLVKGLGDSLTAFSQMHGVTAAQLQNAQAELSSTIAAVTKGNATAYNQYAGSLNRAIALSSNMGVDSSQMSALLLDFMNKSTAELSSQYGSSLAAAGLSVSELQQLVQGGNFDAAVEQLLRGIASTQNNNADTNNVYKGLLRGLGFDAKTINSIAASASNMDTVLRQIKEIDESSQDAMAEKLSNTMLSVGEQWSNFLSSSGLSESMSKMASTLGVTDLRSLTGLVSNVSNAFGTIKGISMKDKNGNASTIGDLLANKDMKSLFSGFGKLAGKAALLAVGMEVLSKVLENDSMKKAMASIMEVINEIMALLGPVIDLIAEELAGALVPVVQSVEKVFSSLAGVLQSEEFKEIISVLMDILKTAMGTISDLVVDLIDPITDAIDTLMEVFVKILPPIMEALKPLLKTLAELIKVMAPVFAKLVKVVAPFLFPLLGFLTVIAKVVMGMAPVFDFLVTVVEGFAKGLAKIGNWLADIEIFGHHPFEFLRSNVSSFSGSSLSIADSMPSINNATSQSSFNSTASLGGLTYGFGVNGQGFHVGQDIPMASGTPLSASQVGIVTDTGSNDIYGNFMSMMGSDGIERIFAHMSDVAASAGDVLFPGQVFGRSGNSGNSISPHVHMETRKSGRFVDPALVARTSDNTDVVIAIRVMTERLERKLEEVSEKTDENAAWIKKFDASRKVPAKAV